MSPEKAGAGVLGRVSAVGSDAEFSSEIRREQVGVARGGHFGRVGLQVFQDHVPRRGHRFTGQQGKERGATDVPR